MHVGTPRWRIATVAIRKWRSCNGSIHNLGPAALGSVYPVETSTSLYNLYMLAYIWIHSSLLNVEYNILLYQLVHVILTCCLSGVHGLLVLTVTTKDLKFSGSRRTVLPVWTPEDRVVMGTWKSGDVSWTLRTDHPPPKRLLRSTVWARDSSMLSKLRDTVEGKRRRQEGETT